MAKIAPKQIHGSTPLVDYLQDTVPPSPAAGEIAVITGVAPGGDWPSPSFDNSAVYFDGTTWKKLYSIESGQRFSLRSKFLQNENEKTAGFDGSQWVSTPPCYGSAFPITQLWPGKHFFRTDQDAGKGIGYTLSADMSTWTPTEYAREGDTLPATTWDGRHFFYTEVIDFGPLNGTDRGLWATWDDVRGAWLGPEEQVEFNESGQLTNNEYLRYGVTRLNAVRGPKVPFDAILTGFAWRSHTNCRGDLNIRRFGVIIHKFADPGRDLAVNNLNIKIAARSVLQVRAGTLSVRGHSVSCILKYRRVF